MPNEKRNKKASSKRSQETNAQDMNIDDSEISKSATKREMHNLQELGETLLAMNTKQRQKFPLSEDLLAALDETKRITKREALRRHKQFIGKVMRNEPEIEVIQGLVSELNEGNTLNSQRFKNLEILREKVIQGSKEEMSTVIDLYPNIDRQKLRQLISKAKKESSQNEAKALADSSSQARLDASRSLFRFLREADEHIEPE